MQVHPVSTDINQLTWRRVGVGVDCLCNDLVAAAYGRSG
jgi:hypothetical protein